MGFYIFCLFVYGCGWLVQCIRVSEGEAKGNLGFQYLTAGLVVMVIGLIAGLKGFLQ